MSDDPLVVVRGLTKHYPITEGVLRREVGRVRAVDGVDLDIGRGESVGLVGESGCGKSTTATTMLRLEEPTAGSVVFDGEEVTAYDREELRRFRRRAQMIFQDPTSSFDPRMTVGDSVGEPLRIHGVRDRERRRQVVEDLLERVGLSAADADRYPHEFSGGQKQRIGLARALVVNPDLIVADEPVSALDVSVQSKILSLLEDVQRSFDLSVLFISHDLGVVREVCDRVAVMYLGKIVEVGPTEAVFEDPLHPYTRALIASIPRPDPRSPGAAVELTGDVPDPSRPPPGCRFHTRCPAVIAPEGVGLDRSVWRGVVDLYVRLRDEGIDVEAARRFLGVGADGAEPAIDDLKRTIRDEFDVPERVADPAVEAAIDDALEAAIAGDTEAARRRLGEAVSTPCEAHHPGLEARGDRRTVACHLYDPSLNPRGVEGVPVED